MLLRRIEDGFKTTTEQNSLDPNIFYSLYLTSATIRQGANTPSIANGIISVVLPILMKSSLDNEEKKLATKTFKELVPFASQISLDFFKKLTDEELANAVTLLINLVEPQYRKKISLALVECADISEQGLLKIGKFQELDALTLISLTQLPETAILTLFKTLQVHRLCIISLSLSTATLDSLGTKTTLKELALSSCNMTDRGVISQDSWWPNAVNQYFDYNYWFQKQFQTLEILDLSHNPLSDPTLNIIAQMPKLRGLGLACTQITDASAKLLCSMKNLNDLSLSGTQLTPKALTVILKILKKLECLKLNETKVNDDVINHLPPKLRHLSLSATEITGVALRHLPPLLISLDLSKNALTNESIAYLLPLKLTNLDLSYCRNLTKPALVTLAKITTLKTLELGSTGITSADIKSINTLEGIAREALPAMYDMQERLDHYI